MANVGRFDDTLIFVEVSEEELELEKHTSFVADPKAGAISSFIGVTRDNFNGKQVTHLEYEAYTSMALKFLKEIAEEMKRTWDICKVAISHRSGVVKIGQASVIIAASSPHRKAALEAVAWAIDELKAKVPIWKKEFFTDGSTWKENAESRHSL